MSGNETALLKGNGTGLNLGLEFEHKQEYDLALEHGLGHGERLGLGIAFELVPKS